MACGDARPTEGDTRILGFGVRRSRGGERGSVLVIVLLIVTGLISMALYFSNAMSLELRAADNRVAGLAAEQAIEGGARYVMSLLSNYATNGYMPEYDWYEAEAVPVGVSPRTEENPRFWLIGRDRSGQMLSEPYFSLIDEASKLDLNAEWLTADALVTNIPGMTYECAQAIIEWRDTNAASGLSYAQLGYEAKGRPYESTSELAMVYGMTRELLLGEDLNMNGVLDGAEEDLDRDGRATPGLLDFFTVFSRHPNTYPDGSMRTNVNDQAGLYVVLEERLGSARAMDVTNRLGQARGQGGGGGGGGGEGGQGEQQIASMLQFFLRSGLTSDEFALVYNDLTATTNAFTVGRVNINTAPAEVLACLPGMDLATAQQIVSYRESNAVDYYSIGWLVDALGSDHPALQVLAEGDYITANSYQFTADIAAVGPYGRGYRRMRYVIDTSEGFPKVIYRQDLSRLGWALGLEQRETWVARNTR